MKMNNLKITVIQSNLYWENKTENLKMFSEKIVAIKEQTDLIVLPEMFTTGFSMSPEKLFDTMDGETIQWMKQEAENKNCVITGSFICKENGRYYNRLVWMKADGSYECYDKRHLFRMAQEDKHYTAGDKKIIVELNGWKICPLICYDLRFPVWARQNSGTENAGPEYDVLIYVANWPERRSLAWKTLLQARAIENQCYVVGVNRVGNDGNNIYHSGDSMVVDPLGEVFYHQKDAEAIYTISLDKAHLENIREKLPFLKDADDFSFQ